jgi:hypothetical protein
MNLGPGSHNPKKIAKTIAWSPCDVASVSKDQQIRLAAGDRGLHEESDGCQNPADASSSSLGRVIFGVAQASLYQLNLFRNL